jgi:hypothetical protein
MAKAVPADSRYIALTTYRRDGREVTTPVWSVPLGGTSCMLSPRRGPQGQAGYARYRLRGVHRDRIVLELTSSPAT